MKREATGYKVGRVAELIREIDTGMLVTKRADTLRGRPMSNNGKVEYDGDSWFFAFKDSGLVEQIDADPTVALAYTATERGTWVSIEGAAEVVEDDRMKRELWDDELRQWFEQGPDDDNVVLVKVHAERVLAWAEGEELVFEPGKGFPRIEAG